MMREYQVRICERLGVKFPGPTRRWRSGVICSLITEIHLLDCTERAIIADGHQRGDFPAPPRREGRKTAIVRRIGNGPVEPYSLSSVIAESLRPLKLEGADAR
jgi:hypothetical protein